MESVKRVLKETLSKRIRQFVPYTVNKSWHYNTKLEHKGFVAIGITYDDFRTHANIRKYMLKNFYPVAPVARALFSLDKQEARDLAEKEMDMYLKSGCSMVLTKVNDNSLESVEGAGMAILWEKDENYKVIGASAQDWFQTATEISHTRQIKFE